MSLAEDVRRTCGSFPVATMDNPFGEDVDVFRVVNKMFALVSDEAVTLKTTPDESEALRAEHSWIRPGYHMNKRHWITVDLDERCDPGELAELIADSYRLIVQSLPKRQPPVAGA